MARPEHASSRRSLLIASLAFSLPFVSASIVAASPSAPAMRSDAALDPARLAIRQKDFDGAMRALGVLAQRGNAHAQYLLGALCLSNPTGEPDAAGAAPLLQQAAAAGEARAAYMLAVIAATATPVDEAAARRWLQRAADGGIAAAADLLRGNRLPLHFLPAMDLELDARSAALLRAARTDDVSLLQL